MTSDPISRFRTQSGARLGDFDVTSQLSAEQLIDSAFRTYRQQAVRLLRPTAVPAGMCFLALAFLVECVAPRMERTTQGSNIGGQMGEMLVAGLIAVFVAGPLFLWGLTYGSCIVVKFVSDAVEGRPTTEGEALATAGRVWPRVFWTSFREMLIASSGILGGVGFFLLAGISTLVVSEDALLPGILVAVGLLAMPFGAIYFLHRLGFTALTPVVAFLEDLSGRAASARSRTLLVIPKNSNLHLIRGGSGLGILWQLGLTMGLVILCTIGLTEAAISILDVANRVGSVFGPGLLRNFAVQAITLTPLYLSVWVLMPLWAVATTILYYDRRVRLEGFDIDRLNQLSQRDASASRFSI